MAASNEYIAESSCPSLISCSSLKYDRISVRISFSTGFLKITRKSIRFPIILWTLAVPCNQTVNSIYWLYWSIVVANRYFCSIKITVNISRTVTLRVLKCFDQCFAQFQCCKSVSSKPAVDPSSRFCEFKTLFKHWSRAKHWFKNLKILDRLWKMLFILNEKVISYYNHETFWSHT